MSILKPRKATKVETLNNESLMVVIKYLESLGEDEAKLSLSSLPKEGFMKDSIVDYFFKEASKSGESLTKKHEFSQIEYSARNISF